MPWTEILPSGRHRGMYRLPTGEKRSAGTFDHKRAAMAAARAAEVDAARSGHDPRKGKTTWGEWYAKWAPTRAIEPRVAQSEESMVRIHIMPTFGDRELASITRHDVQAWATKLAKANRSDKAAPRRLAAGTVSRVLTVLGASLAAAVDAELIQANPATRIKTAPASKGRLVWITREEYAALVDAIPHDADKAIADFLVGTGARWGEMAGTHVYALDLVAKKVSIRDVWTGTDIRAYTKTGDAREVPVMDWSLRHLTAGSRAQGCGQVHRDGSRCTTPLLFPNLDGRPLDDRNWSRRVLAPAIAAAGLEGRGITIYAFRHTYASWLVQDGVPLLRVAQLLGHKSTRTTEIYAHLAPANIDDVRAALRAPERWGGGERPPLRAV